MPHHRSPKCTKIVDRSVLAIMNVGTGGNAAHGCRWRSPSGLGGPMGETRKRADGVRRRFGQGLVVAAAITTGGWARANVITVTSFTDVAGDQKCGLMEAIFASVSHAQSDACNAGSGNDTIQLDTGTY